MLVIPRGVGQKIVLGSPPNQVTVTIHRIQGDRVAISIENAASVERGEIAGARIEQAEPERPAE